MSPIVQSSWSVSVSSAIATNVHPAAVLLAQIVMMKFRPLLRQSMAPILLTTTFLTGLSFVPRRTIHPSRPTTSTTTRLFRSASSTLPPLLDSSGTPLTAEETARQLQGKQVAYYFAAGWCPMCTRFEPSLLQFHQEHQDQIEIIYVGSDRSEHAALQRASSMKFLAVPFGEPADQIKKEFGVWAGAESMKFGVTGRRSGVPALVVLNGETGKELKFLPAESQGANALKSWPLHDSQGLF
jgi:nucleoredoxin